MPARGPCKLEVSIIKILGVAGIRKERICDPEWIARAHTRLWVECAEVLQRHEPQRDRSLGLVQRVLFQLDHTTNASGIDALPAVQLDDAGRPDQPDIGCLDARQVVEIGIDGFTYLSVAYMERYSEKGKEDW